MKSKICTLCGKEFIPTSNAQRVCSDKHYRKCEICGKMFEIKRPSNSQLCCSKRCTSEKRKRTMLERHGVEYAQQSQEIRDKSIQTNIRKFGYPSAAQSPEIKDKERKIFQERYGVDSPFQMEDFQDKRKKTCLEKYGVEHHLQSKDSVERMKAHWSETLMEEYGVPYGVLTPQCQQAHPGLISGINKQFAEELRNRHIDYRFEKKIEDKSFDIEILNKKIFIEIDPTYTHSTVKNHWGCYKQALDHLDKTKLAESYGYRCIHVFDWDDWKHILHMLDFSKIIYARKCKLQIIDVNTAKSFEREYHLQGGCNGQTACIGLYSNDELIQLMTFGRPRYTHRYEWELLRLCTKAGIRVVGGSSKLFKRFVEMYDPGSIISYCDLSKFRGVTYSKLGFDLDHNSEPSKVWSKGKHKITDNLLRQRGYDQLFGTNYGKGTSNEQLMIEHGWLPVYDCGQAVYVWRNN